MFTTVSVKEHWQTVFCCGNPDAKEVVMILGSCRVVPYINYLAHANSVCGNRFKIYAIDPINYMVDAAGNRLDTAGLLKALETDDRFLSILRSVTIFVHEGLSSFGILNTVRDAPVRIYDFGMRPVIDVSIPNFHDHFILVNDFKAIDPKYRDRELTAEDEREIFEEGNRQIERFVSVCGKSSFPEFGPWFLENWLRVRLFHSFNHVSSAFTLKIFELANEKFLKLELDDNYWNQIGQQDIYANVQTAVTDLDRRWRAFKFP